MLAWLLDEQTAPAVRRLLGEAEVIVASDLTLIECDRVLLRVVALKELTEAEAADRRAHLNAAAAHWHVLRIAAEIVDRARRPFRDRSHLQSSMKGSSPNTRQRTMHHFLAWMARLTDHTPIRSGSHPEFRSADDNGCP